MLLLHVVGKDVYQQSSGQRDSSPGGARLLQFEQEIRAAAAKCAQEQSGLQNAASLRACGVVVASHKYNKACVASKSEHSFRWR